MTKEEKVFTVKQLKGWQKNPLPYIHEILHIKTWSGMRYIIDSVWNNKRTSVRASHGVSKTFSAAVIAVTFLNLFKNAIVITTGPTERQVKNLLWKEIGAIYKRCPGAVMGKTTSSPLTVHIAPEWYMVGFSTDNATSIEGYHAPNILWILDEAKGLPSWVYDSLEGSMTGGNSRVLEISTTDGADQQTAFFQHHHKERAQWKTIHLSAFDSPFVKVESFKELNPRRLKILHDYGKPVKGQEWPDELRDRIQIVDEDYIKEKADTWKRSRVDLWQTKIEGNLLNVSAHNIIPLLWVESAINAEVVNTNNTITYGLDVGAGGDPSVLVKKVDKKVEYVYDWVDANTMSTTGLVVRRVNEAPGITRVDMIGVGHGVFNRLDELGKPVIGIDSRNKPALEFEEVYLNLRSQMWFNMRDIFEAQYLHGNVISIPDDAELIEELTIVMFKTMSNGRIVVESKEELKKESRLGRSTNKADALIYACADLGSLMDEEM